MPADAAKAAGLLFLVVVIQLSVMANVDILGGHPNLLLVTLVCVSLLRGAIFGAVAGFCAGLLMDTGVFGTLGFTALLLTVAGYWTGRYGETTGRDRAHAPLLSIAVITVLYQISALVLRYMLGEPAPAHHIFAALAPDRVAQSDPDRPGLRVDAPSAPSARMGHTGGASPWLTSGAPRGASCRPTLTPWSRTGSRRSSPCEWGSSACSRSRSSPRSSFVCGRCRS